MKKLFLLLTLSVSIFSCSKDEEVSSEAIAQNFVIGSNDVGFKGAAFIDWGHDKDSDEYNMTFWLTSEKYDTNKDLASGYNNILEVDLYSDGNSFRYGTYTAKQINESWGGVTFGENGKEFSLASGNVIIEKNSTDNFTLTVDGVLDNGKAIKGTYKGAFTKEKGINIDL